MLPFRRGPLRIVVADDDRDTVLALKLLLRSEGHRVQAVYRGSHVMDAVRDFDPHVVLLDIAMPGMSGHQVAREIRARHDKRLILIGISGRYQESYDRTIAVLNGFDHYLLKPYEPRALLALLA